MRRASCSSALGLVLGSALLLGVAPGVAQPSGGPYGPIQHLYELPSGHHRILYVSPDGLAGNPGSTVSDPTTLEAAIERARTGDVIVMRGGTYRTGNLVTNQGITLQPYRDERPEWKGTRVATEWKTQPNGLWTTKWATLFPQKPQSWWRRETEGKKTPPEKFNNDMVFVDGKFLQAVAWEGDVTEETYCIDYTSGLVYLGVDPAKHLVEITAHDIALLRTTAECHGVASDRQGYTLRGITFLQFAYRALEVEGTEPEGISPEANHGKEVVGTTLENCTIAFCSRVAGYFRGDHTTIRHCKVTDTSTEGIYLIASNDCLLEGNLFARNNIERITGYYPAVVKIFNQCYRVTCRDNLVTDLPWSNGIWYDVGNVDGVFANNWLENVGRTDLTVNPQGLWPSDNAFFFEISKGVTCAGNVFVNCDHGILILNSSNARIYRNTFVNSIAAIGRNERSAAGDHFGWHPSTGPDVDERHGHEFVDNLLVAGPGFGRPLLFVWEPKSLCPKLPDAPLQTMLHNTMVRAGADSESPAILWTPSPVPECQAGYATPEEFAKSHAGVGADTRWLPDYQGPLFRSMELHDFHLLPGFSAGSTAGALPRDIRTLLDRNDRTVGAYPLPE